MNIKIIYSKYSNTFRLMPYNYWLASVKENKLTFDSWDGMTKKKFKENPFLKFKIIMFYLLLKINNKL
jgi:hypothetical protein